MNARIRLSSKGQIVIPKDIRDALRLKAGEELTVVRHGHRIVLEQARSQLKKISYDEFRRRMPKYQGTPVAVEDMTTDIDRLFRKWRG
jgi:AbrB family looped-hinge helix DNA binding protein